MPPQDPEIEDEVPPWIFDVPEIPASQMKRDKNENGLKIKIDKKESLLNF